MDDLETTVKLQAEIIAAKDKVMAGEVARIDAMMARIAKRIAELDVILARVKRP